MTSADFVHWKKEQVVVKASPKSHRFVLHVQYPSAEAATVVKNALAIDEEVRPDRVLRTCTLEAPATLVYTFDATERRFLRVAVSSCCTAQNLIQRHVALSVRDNM
eukprot:g33646.t1